MRRKPPCVMTSPLKDDASKPGLVPRKFFTWCTPVSFDRWELPETGSGDPGGTGMVFGSAGEHPDAPVCQWHGVQQGRPTFLPYLPPFLGTAHKCLRIFLFSPPVQTHVEQGAQSLCRIQQIRQPNFGIHLQYFLRFVFALHYHWFKIISLCVVLV